MWVPLQLLWFWWQPSWRSSYWNSILSIIRNEKIESTPGIDESTYPPRQSCGHYLAISKWCGASMGIGRTKFGIINYFIEMAFTTTAFSCLCYCLNFQPWFVWVACRVLIKLSLAVRWFLNAWDNLLKFWSSVVLNSISMRGWCTAPVDVSTRQKDSSAKLCSNPIIHDLFGKVSEPCPTVKGEHPQQKEAFTFVQSECTSMRGCTILGKGEASWAKRDRFVEAQRKWKHF